MKLIDEAKQFYKMLSVQLAAAAAVVSAYLASVPDAAIQAWNALPADMKAFLPQNFLPYVAVGLTVLSIFGRLIKQPSLRKGQDADAGN